MDRLDLPDEPAPMQPIVELAGHSRVLIENHLGVIQYGRQQICVKVKYGVVEVSGQKLELKRMTRAQLIISGCIDCVRLQRRTL